MKKLQTAAAGGATEQRRAPDYYDGLNSGALKIKVRTG